MTFLPHLPFHFCPSSQSPGRDHCCALQSPPRDKISRAVCAGIPSLIQHPLSVLPAQGALKRNSSSAAQPRDTTGLGTHGRTGCAPSGDSKWDRLKPLSLKLMAVLHLKTPRGAFTPFWDPLKSHPSPSLPALVRPSGKSHQPSPCCWQQHSCGAGRRKDTTLQYHMK